MVRAGAVYVGRRRVEDPDRALDAGERVTVHVAAVDAAPPATLAIVHADPTCSWSTSRPACRARPRASRRPARSIAWWPRSSRARACSTDSTATPAGWSCSPARRRRSGASPRGCAPATSSGATWRSPWGHVAADGGRLERADRTRPARSPAHERGPRPSGLAPSIGWCAAAALRAARRRRCSRSISRPAAPTRSACTWRTPATRCRGDRLYGRRAGDRAAVPARVQAGLARCAGGHVACAAAAGRAWWPEGVAAAPRATDSARRCGTSRRTC